MRRILLFLVTFLPVATFAQGFQVNLAGQKQIGMGHTGTGLAQDGASVFFNPGAVAMLSQNSIQAGISPLLFKSAFNPAGTNDIYRTSNEVGTPFSAYAVWGPKASFWKVGLGVYTPFGGLTNWGNNWEGKYVVESLNLKAIYFQPTISIKLADFISIGGGFVYNHGEVDLSRAIPLANASGQDGQAELKGSGKGYGWNAGVYVKTESGVTVGLSYRSKVKTTINNGDAFFTVPGSLQASFPQPNTFSASLPLPATTTLGLGFYPSKKWTVAFDANLVSWHVYKALEFDYAKNTSALQDTYSPRQYRDAFSLRAGTEYRPVNKWAIRAGGGVASAAARNGYVTPEVPDAKRYYLTGGLGYTLANRLDLDLSFEFEHLFARKQTNIESQLSGTFRSNVYIPGVSLSYHW
ncbi:outer membrane protein transport protein [Mucilaginibacter sp. RS28]|uniref:Outer membrane protein transport protein n=1 Tax=Mucilaginibacter straminoryzae TaxID=2932774 RepID=A0A9X1X693_9SPHI|nr:outer membrane protein transport protein [Mucilaginibacter straminoryzae]MCJ8209419.1 outer membrane protein transport protein [Mucilaginibacter straminoryzae]